MASTSKPAAPPCSPRPAAKLDPRSSASTLRRSSTAGPNAIAWAISAGQPICQPCVGRSTTPRISSWCGGFTRRFIRPSRTSRLTISWRCSRRSPVWRRSTPAIGATRARPSRPRLRRAAPSSRARRMSERYKKSESLLERARRTIPLGSQTFSKSFTQYPFGVSPYFIARGQGSRVWDVDGNEYVDFVNGLCAVTLGYGDPDVTRAVKAQLDDGVIFSLPHPLEVEVAEAIVDMVPCAEAVRFGKNGSDATAGAVRLARAYTRRDHVAVCGYHGWQDWYIGSTARSRGVPESVKQLTHTFAYNDLESLQRIFKAHAGEVAAVILEPMNAVAPKDGFLQAVKE